MAKGIIAAGHDLTVKAAEDILADGGNAFDAAIAACYAAFLAEPVLASPGGGGFMLARCRDDDAMLYDFFVQTPADSRSDDIDFQPIVADFGEARQEFHIGLGSIAVPGVLRGLFQVHEDLATMPMTELVAPALAMAREGVPVNAFQSYVFDVIAPIFLHDKASREYFSSRHSQKKLLAEGDVHFPFSLADTLEAIAIEGERLFYEGEIAAQIVNACRSGGGLLGFDDLLAYRCIKRKPLQFDYRDCHVLTNPSPSSGGVLIAFALKLLEQLDMASLAPGGLPALNNLILAMELTQQARLQPGQDEDRVTRLLDPDLLDQYRKDIMDRAAAYRGTTHISIIDRWDNMAALTLSNGEGCGYMLGDTGMMLNNMLGEQDLNPHGFFRWQPGRRMTSMMAPSLMLFDDGRHVVTGSGGSNRIRTALMQLMVNLVDYSMSVEQAVAAPRLHFENHTLDIEGLFDETVTAQLGASFRTCQVWPARNLFFGGAHTVMRREESFSGAGDERRGGVCKLVC